MCMHARRLRRATPRAGPVHPSMIDGELADEGGAWTTHTHSDADMHARTDVNRAQQRSSPALVISWARVALATSSCPAPTRCYSWFSPPRIHFCTSWQGNIRASVPLVSSAPSFRPYVQSLFASTYQSVYQLESTIFFSHNKTVSVDLSVDFNTSRTGQQASKICLFHTTYVVHSDPSSLIMPK